MSTQNSAACFYFPAWPIRIFADGSYLYVRLDGRMYRRVPVREVVDFSEDGVPFRFTIHSHVDELVLDREYWLSKPDIVEEHMRSLGLSSSSDKENQG
jgi:hypothetical protein